MKKIIYSLSIITFLAILMAGCYSSSPATSGNTYARPDWALAYEPGVRYYYFPDIETYYDVTTGNFVYFNHGQWLYSSNLPPAYRGYDLYNGYRVVLDRRVYQPWRYHQNYFSSYPPYYYRNYYGTTYRDGLRGYNENNRNPVYISPSDRSRRTTTSPSSSPSDVNRSTTRESRSGDYSSRRVGKPVQVTPEMRQPNQSNSSRSATPGSSRRQNNSSGTGIGSGTETNDRDVQPRSNSDSPQPSVRRNSNDNPQQNRTDSNNNDEEKKSSRRR